MSEELSIHQEKNNISSDEDNNQNINYINHSVKNVKKTLIQRRKQKEQQKLQQLRIKQKVEKKKVVDIYHLNNLTDEILKKQRAEKLLRQKRLQVKVQKELQPKILSKNKFEPFDQEFQMRDELSGNLRCTQPVGNLLKERYKSFQQRNIIAPGTLVL
jgi:nucleolar protein 53